ncbi:FAD-dependent oxidoreductase [Salmonella enterica subsp. enterica]|uniref:MarR family winged helix-turn-helix transcriptional regulator n=1 Tax=Salmonella enterica TaxID=28901 RepID=UPI000A3CA837|nr:FAD-dependent oxidoreductase [Salmonella enterica]
MTTYTTTDVLICGAGVTGLTLAIELARHGVSFRLIEKRTTPFTGSRGKGFQPRTQEIFEDIGILNKVVAKLEKLGLIIRQHNAIDRRIREAVISRTGKAMTERIDAAREQMGKVVFKDWPQDELDVFVRLMQKFADAMDSDASMPE